MTSWNHAVGISQKQTAETLSHVEFHSMSLQLLNNQPSSSLIVAKILQMVLENSIAAISRRQRPHSVQALNVLRTQLLRDDFFDPNHNPTELRVRRSASTILFMDLAVLLARMMRVLMRRGPLHEDDVTERVAVRNEALDQPFFDRSTAGDGHPFTRQEPEDEGCFM